MTLSRLCCRIFCSRAAVFVVLALAWLGSKPPSALAQADRYELGRRLREFEIDWDRTEAPAARAMASQSFKVAVDAFFSFRLGEAGKAIGEARFALKGDKGPTDAERWVDSLCVRPEGRLLDASSAALSVTIASFFPNTIPKPEGAKILLSMAGSAESKVEAPLGALPLSLSVPLKDLDAGDHVLKAEVVVGDSTFPLGSETISLAENLDDRIIALKKVMEGWPTDTNSATVDRESARGQLRMIESLAAKLTLEADFPANKILASLEEQTLAADQSEPYLGRSRTGQFWATLVTKSGRKVPSRIFVPEAAAKGDLLPLVVALHGAGGSENMFFETYGHGAIVDRCRERGWLLIAPRSTAYSGTPIEEIVEEMAKLYPVDLKKVMLIGHSMGAGQAVAAASSTPSKFAAIAALGGGGQVPLTASLKALPIFVGVGSEDFALDGATSLVKSLKRAGVATLIYREYPNIEHLAIVQVALGDVFRFFDERVK
jgi:predicted esterase